MATKFNVYDLDPGAQIKSNGQTVMLYARVHAVHLYRRLPSSGLFTTAICPGRFLGFCSDSTHSSNSFTTVKEDRLHHRAADRIIHAVPLSAIVCGRHLQVDERLQEIHDVHTEYGRSSGIHFWILSRAYMYS